MATYRSNEVVNAYQVEAPGEQVFTRNGTQWASAGSWVVFKAIGVIVMDNGTFTAEFSEWVVPEGEEEIALTDEEIAEWVAGSNVATVVEFMAANPNLVADIQAAEKAGANRKGIVEYR